MAPTEQQLKQNRAEQLAGIKKSPKARVQRYLKRTTVSKIKENGKCTLYFQGIKCSNSMLLLLRELKLLQTPHSKLLTKKNNVLAFDGYSTKSNAKHSTASASTDAGPPCNIDFLCTKNDCSLFCMASHNKKRPNNLLIGRTFANQLLDMIELRIQYFKSMNDYNSTTDNDQVQTEEIPKKRIGSKPLLLFIGNVWNNSSNIMYSKVQNLLIDFYRGDVVDSIVASGIDHIIVFTANSTTTSTTTSSDSSSTVMIHQRTYFIKLKKGTSDTSKSDSTNSVVPPEPLLIPCGPDLDYSIGRTQWADDDTARAARKLPGRVKSKQIVDSNTTTKLKLKSKKNTSTNIFGETMGRLHVPKQYVDGRQTGRKMKSLRRADQLASTQEKLAIESELQNEQQS